MINLSLSTTKTRHRHGMKSTWTLAKVFMAGRLARAKFRTESQPQQGVGGTEKEKKRGREAKEAKQHPGHNRFLSYYLNTLTITLIHEHAELYK